MLGHVDGGFARPLQVENRRILTREIRREMRFRFESNTVGGNYQMGQIIAHIEPATGTVLGENP